MSLPNVARKAFFLVSGILLTGAAVHAQEDRIVKSIDASHRIVLKGNRSFQARLEGDRGRLDSGEPVSGITMLLKSSPIQRAALERLLEQQRDPASPNYHKWLTPEEYADRFGLSGNDYHKIVSWLRSEGFRVDYQARARNWLAFSGTVGQVQAAFHTEIHHYVSDGETHYANAADPEIPAALEPVAMVIRGLDDFHLKPGVRIRNPHLTMSNGIHAVGPGDLATIYDVNPLYQAGITGSGQTIAIVGQTNIHMSDIQDFRSSFGLPANNPQMVLVPGFPDPGIIADEGEADLDLEYAGGLAPDAKILFVYSPDVVVSAQYAIDQALSPVISMSYGGCEQRNTSGPESVTAIQAFAQQGNAQGITWVASSGDVGAAGCERQQADKVGVNGPGVQTPASTPKITGVGGTEYNDGTGSGYWDTTNDSHKASALSYIPEMAWNDTTLEGALASGSGGASMIFPKPAWQTGPGVPNDNARDVPDVAFTASWDHDPYILFTAGGRVVPSGGTSAATPSFAGMLALLNQYLVSTGVLSGPGLGNINPTLYTLAQRTTNVFHDVTVGGNIVPCGPGTPGCDTGSYGYRAGPGYDQATGLGSIDVRW
jgi:subtilase family serine protease